MMLRHDGPVYGLGLVQKGRLRIEQSNFFAAQLQLLRDGVVEICIERKRATRSQQQNRFYWAILGILAEDTGHTTEELHHTFRRRFLPKKLALCSRDGEILYEDTVGRSTTKLSIGEFTEYLDKIQAVAARLGCVLPDEIPAPAAPDRSLSLAPSAAGTARAVGAGVRP